MSKHSALPPDHAARVRALAPGQSFIVQAPAGSGKTELLVRRYLALLAIVEAPENILAITFTRKATAEMLARIRNALRKQKTDGEPEDNPELLKLVDAALKNDARRGWEINANPRRLRVQTIDSLCTELVRRMPWSARFGAPPEIMEDATPLYQEAANNTLEKMEGGDEIAAACACLLKLVDAHWAKARELLAEMLAKRDKWMRSVLPNTPDQGNEKKDRARFEKMWQGVIDSELERLGETVPHSVRQNLVELGVSAGENIRATKPDSPIADLAGVSEFPPPTHTALAQWLGIAELLLTQQGAVRKQVDKRLGFLPNTEAKTEMQDLLENLPPHVTALHLVRQLPDGQFSDARWQILNALIQVLRLAVGELQVLFQRQNCADYIELTQRASDALGEPQAPTDLALVLDYKLTHILMDEFQDTSSAHIDLLQKLTAGWQADDGRTLFLVGDPMQSIYRFRQAEVGNFLDVRDNGLGDLRLESLTLESNFRSGEALVDWFNATFSEVLPRQDDPLNGAVRYTTARAYLRGEGGGVRQHFLPQTEATDADAETQYLVDLVAETHAENPDQDIAVLGRTRGHLHAIAAELRRRGTDFEAVDLEKLGHRAAIRDLLALTRILVDPADRIAYLSLLRAPWCGLTLDDLLRLTRAREDGLLLELGDEDALESLSADGRARVVRLRERLRFALERRGRMGLRENVEAAWLGLNAPATLVAADLENCQRYLEKLSEMQTAQTEINAESLQSAVDELWARSGSEAKVQLLTIHKAKGLEFEQVFIPSMHKRGRSDDKELLRWRKLPDQLLLAPLPARADDGDANYAYLGHLEKTHAEHELRRLLYVACTRARVGLHLVGCVRADVDGGGKPPPASSLLGVLWDALPTPEILNAEGAADTGTSVIDPAAYGLQRLPVDWRPPPLPADIPLLRGEPAATEPALEFSWAGEVARVSGTVIHQILQHVEAQSWDEWRAQPIDEAQRAVWRRLLMENGMYGDTLDDALQRVVNAITQTRKDPKAAWIFSAAHREIKAEWALSARLDGRVENVVIDRSFIDSDGSHWIIDFKSGRHEGGGVEEFLDREQERHAPQLTRYAQVLRQLRGEPENAIKLGLYFPALPGWREWDAG